MRVLPPCAALPSAFAQTSLGLPTHVLARRGELFAAELQVPTARGRGAIGPGAFYQGTTGRGLPGLRHASLASALAPGRFRRRQAPSMHAWAGAIAAGQVAECRDGRDRHGPLYATEGWPCCHDRAEPPRGDLLVEVRCQALEPVRVGGDRPDICWADEVLGGGGTDDRAQPAPGRRTPGGPAGIPAILPEQKGVEAALGRLEIVERLRSRAAPVTTRFGLGRGDLDWGEVP